MADGDGPVASAVIIPEPEESQPLPSKRRQSSTSQSPSTKRPRISNDASVESATCLRESPQPIEPLKDAPVNVKPTDERRKSSVQEERKRGQRLFGGLLSTLSQSTPNGQQKRRLEIEKRQQERAKQQKEEDEVRRAEKLAKLKAIRKTEQVKFDEQSMQIRHSNTLAMANFLQTKAEPKLFYKPWQLLSQQEECIKNQIAEAEALIEREVTEFKARQPQEKPQGETETEDTNGTSKETAGEPATESPSVPSLALVDTTNIPDVQAPQSESKTEKLALEEHNGEVVVENEEDTVIY
ncbi:related to nuclear protein SDK3 [Phialocephala subalpina]|uniref:Related to nuclear protein SDK3 n=1 Tax=Phialocephala subalpina TaxID=576137 RepID=A0A1L7X8N4_9HELO|nr:related to nuclear protein SDK3 [Phialocephala subalpina]